MSDIASCIRTLVFLAMAGICMAGGIVYAQQDTTVGFKNGGLKNFGFSNSGLDDDLLNLSIKPMKPGFNVKPVEYQNPFFTIKSPLLTQKKTATTFPGMIRSEFRPSVTSSTSCVKFDNLSKVFKSFSFLDDVPEKPSMMRLDPTKVTGIPSNNEKKETDNELPDVSFVSNVGHFLDISVRHPTSMGIVGYGADGQPFGPRVRDMKRYVSTSMYVPLGERGWYLRTGIYMDGWYEPGVGDKIYDAFLKFNPKSVFSFTGYSPVLGLEKRFGKRSRTKVSLMYGLVPPGSGINVFSHDKNRHQFRASATIMLK